MVVDNNEMEISNNGENVNIYSQSTLINFPEKRLRFFRLIFSNFLSLKNFVVKKNFHEQIGMERESAASSICFWQYRKTNTVVMRIISYKYWNSGWRERAASSIFVKPKKKTRERERNRKRVFESARIPASYVIPCRIQAS